MSRRMIFGLAVAVLLVPPAQAASFDCTKARTPFAKAICTHPDLSTADDKLAAAFAKALEGLSPPAHAAVSKGQDGWVYFANRACIDTAKPATRPYDANGIGCLTDLFTNRTEQLQEGRTMGGLRLYYVDRFAALRDPDAADSSVKVATKSVSTPRIDGTDAEAVAFNRFIETDTRKDIDPTIADHPRPADGGDDEADSMVVTAVDATRISMTLNSYDYPHGAAHGSYGVSYIHYLREPRRRLVASDVFTAPGWQGKLQQLALVAVKKQEGEDLMLDDPKSIDPLVIDPARWDFSKDGLILQFEPYEIAPFAAGAPTVTLPWAELSPLLAPGASAFQH